jgi:hypothetical protein
MVAIVPPTESTPTIGAEANVPNTTVSTATPEITSTTIEVPSSQITKLSHWWELHREGIVSAVIKVFGVTSKALELMPLAEPAAKAFEHAASILEEVQVSVTLGERSPVVCTDERATFQRSWENLDAIRDLVQQMERITVALDGCEQPLPPAMLQRIKKLRE